MLVNFSLRSPADITPWSTANGEPTLHWFGHTLGWYWINLGGAELFRYHDESLAHWARTVPGEFRSPYDEYEVARLHEDLLSMLPAVLEPVPPPVAARLHPPDQWRTWLERANE